MAKGKHKKQQKQNTQSEQSQVSIQPQSSKPIDQRQRQIKKQCDEMFAMYAKDIRDKLAALKDDIALDIQSRNPEHPLNSLIGRSIDYMDYDNIRMNYRKQKTVSVAGKLKEYLAELYDDLSSMISVEHEWVSMNSLPNATYDCIDNSAYVHTGTVIWILDQIKKTKKPENWLDCCRIEAAPKICVWKCRIYGILVLTLMS